MCIGFEEAVANRLVVTQKGRPWWGIPTQSGAASDAITVCPFCGHKLGRWHGSRRVRRLKVDRGAFFHATPSDLDGTAANEVAVALGEQAGLKLKPFSLVFAQSIRGAAWVAPRSPWQRPCVVVEAEADLASGMNVYATLTLWRGRPVSLKLSRGDGPQAHAAGLRDLNWDIWSQRLTWRPEKPC